MKPQDVKRAPSLHTIASDRDREGECLDAIAVVYVVDDDEVMRRAVMELLKLAGHVVRGFENAARARDAAFDSAPGCIVVDVRMPGMDGLALQRELVPLGTPVIIMTGHADIAMGVGAMKSGAYDFLTKPFRDQDLLEAVSGALQREAEDRPKRDELKRLRSAHAALSRREELIITEVASGIPNKTIARSLGISEVTVKVTRARIMRKMGAQTSAHMIRFAEKIGLIDKNK